MLLKAICYCVLTPSNEMTRPANVHLAFSLWLKAQTWKELFSLIQSYSQEFKKTFSSTVHSNSPQGLSKTFLTFTNLACLGFLKSFQAPNKTSIQHLTKIHWSFWVKLLGCQSKKKKIQGGLCISERPYTLPGWARKKPGRKRSCCCGLLMICPRGCK